MQPDEGSKVKTPSILEKFGNVQPGPWSDGYSLKAPNALQSKSPTLWNDYVAYSSMDVTPVLAAQSTLSNALFAQSLYATAQRGITTLTNPGADIFRLGDHMVVLDGTQRPGFNPNQTPMTGSSVVQGLSATGVLTNALKSGAGMGVLLAPVGTTIEYSIQGKPILSENWGKNMLVGSGSVFTNDFNADVSVDMLKGLTSGAVGGAVTTLTIGLAALTVGAIGAPVIVGAAAVGFLASWAFGEYIFDGTLRGDDMKKWLKNK